MELDWLSKIIETHGVGVAFSFILMLILFGASRALSRKTVLQAESQAAVNTSEASGQKIIIDTVNNAMTSLLRMYEDTTKRFDGVTQAHNNLAHEHSDLKAKFAALSATHETSIQLGEKIRADLEKRLEKSENTRETLEKRWADERKAMEARVTALEAEVGQLQANLTQANTEHKKAETELAEAVKAKQAVEGERDMLLEKVRALEERVMILESEKGDMDKRIKAQSEEIQLLKAKLEKEEVSEKL